MLIRAAPAEPDSSPMAFFCTMVWMEASCPIPVIVWLVIA